MSDGLLIFGIKIYTRTTATDASIGLSNGIFQLIQVSVSGFSDWKAGLIAAGGLGQWSNDVNVFDGGNIASGSFSFTLSNVINLNSLLEFYSINLDGCIVEIYEFNNSGNILRGTFRCQKPEIDNRKISINCLSLAPGRVAQILKQINSDDFPNADSEIINNFIPATFGKIIPAFDSLGAFTRQSIPKFIRTENKQDNIIYSDDFFNNTGITDITIFPVTAIVPPVTYDVQLAGISSSHSILEPDADTYVTIFEGSASVGQIRQVTSWFLVFSFGLVYLRFTIKDVFTNELSHASDDTRSWVQFSKIFRSYNDDNFPCKDFLISSTGLSTITPELYSESNNNFQRIADFGFTVNESGNKNALDIDGEQYSNNIDNLKSFIILPITSLALETTANLDQWNDLGYSKVHDGIYNNGHSPDTGVTNNILYNASSAYDKNSTTYAEYSPIIDHLSPPSDDPDRVDTVVLKFGLPKIPIGLDIKSISIGARIKSYIQLTGSPVSVPEDYHFKLRRFGFSKSTDAVLVHSPYIVSDVNIEDLPDFYYDDSVSTNNVNFYKITSLTGYTTFAIPGATSRGVYNTYVEGAILQSGNDYPSSKFTYFNQIYELAIIVELNDSSITDKIYSPASGRIFNSTWGRGKDPTDLISKPRDLLEHICRLQNFSESSSQPTAGWGLDYAATPLIDTASFDALSTIDSFLPATQIENEADGFTDKVKYSICKNFGLISFINSAGEESVKPLLTLPSSIDTALIFGDIIDRSTIKVSQWPIDKCYPELQVNYNKDYITSNLASSIQINHSDAESYTSSYVVGVTDPLDAAQLWNEAHLLFLQSEKPSVAKLPTTLTDLLWADAEGGYNIALNYARFMQQLMKSKIIEFDIHYYKVSELEIGDFLTFNSPKHTNGNQNCQIISIKHSTNYPYKSHIQALLLPALEIPDALIQQSGSYIIQQGNDLIALN